MPLDLTIAMPLTLDNKREGFTVLLTVAFYRTFVHIPLVFEKG